MTASRRTLVALAAAAAAATGAAPAQAAPAAPTSADAKAYGKQCQGQSKRPTGTSKGTDFSRCVTAMSRLARAQSRSPRLACAPLSSPAARGRCVAAGTRLVRHGNGIDRAYIEGMIPHHVSAVAMAQLALTRGQSTYVRKLARTIIDAQRTEIARMRTLLARMKSTGVKPASLGLTKAQMGMDHDVSHLTSAKPFDPAFVDMMIPHHQGALTMGRVVVAKGVSPAVAKLAKQIVVDQTREIGQMRTFRRSVPAAGGGSPAAPGAPAGGGGSEPHH